MQSGLGSSFARVILAGLEIVAQTCWLADARYIFFWGEGGCGGGGVQSAPNPTDPWAGL